MLIREIPLSSCKHGLYIPENLVHFSSVPLTLSTVSALLLAASYPNLYSTLSPILLNVCLFVCFWETSSCQNIYSFAVKINFTYWSICQHIFWKFIAYGLLGHTVWPDQPTPVEWRGGQWVGRWMSKWISFKRKIQRLWRLNNDLQIGSHS